MSGCPDLLCICINCIIRKILSILTTGPPPNSMIDVLACLYLPKDEYIVTLKIYKVVIMINEVRIKGLNEKP